MTGGTTEPASQTGAPLAPIEVASVALRRIELPLVVPFRTSFGVERERDILLVEVHARSERGDHVTGWGECVALTEPTYSAEYVDGAEHVVEHHLAHRVFDGSALDAADVAVRIGHFHGHPMAKGAIEMAILDAQLRAADRSFASWIGATADRIPSGVSVGIHDDVDDLLATVQGYLDDGYVRIKLKIEPAAISTTSARSAR